MEGSRHNTSSLATLPGLLSRSRASGCASLYGLSGYKGVNMLDIQSSILRWDYVDEAVRAITPLLPPNDLLRTSLSTFFRSVKFVAIRLAILEGGLCAGRCLVLSGRTM